jgi:predicted transcriptional regulator
MTVKGCPFLDRNIRMLPCQKERALEMAKDGISNRRLARIFGVTPTTIQYLKNPEAYEAMKRRAAEVWREYYDPRFARAKYLSGIEAKRKLQNILR